MARPPCANMQRRTAKAPSAGERPRELSVIVPCYAEQDNVRELVRRLVGACDAAGITLDCLFVDDASAGSYETEQHVRDLQ